MKQLEKPVAESPHSGGILNHLAVHDILIPNRDDVEGYAALHHDLAYLLNDICRKAREAFGPDTELSLELYRDPEIDDRYMTLFVRQEPYRPDIIERIESVSSGFHHSLEAVSGYFLVTTDFRRPREANVV